LFETSTDFSKLQQDIEEVTVQELEQNYSGGI
jgi:hypothetical protein